MSEYLLADRLRIAGRYKSTPEDFIVEELPVYAPKGQGEHCMLEIRKRGLSTPQAVQKICKLLGCSIRDAGWAGLKDAQAVTTQWISLQRLQEGKVEESRDALRATGIEILNRLHRALNMSCSDQTRVGLNRAVASAFERVP